MDVTEFLHQAMPFCATLGVRGIRMDRDAVELELDWAPTAAPRPGSCTVVS